MRLTMNLSPEAYQRLRGLACLRKSTMTEVIRFALGLFEFVLMEKKAGHKLLIGDAKGDVLREVVLPPR